MNKNSVFPSAVSSHFRAERSVIFFLVASCHVLLITFFTFFDRSPRLEEILITRGLATLITLKPVKKITDIDAKNPLTKTENSTPRHSVQNRLEAKNQARMSSSSESKNVTDRVIPEQYSAEKGNTVNGELGVVSSKELAALGSVGARYKLEIPKGEVAQALTPAQQAAQDVRTNSVRLSKSEKFAVVVGALDCIFQTRNADGTIVRVPGRWVEVRPRDEFGYKSIAAPKVRFCVRFNQAEDENGNDLTAISSGIKGKL
jgi:hypothetical protein